MTTRPLAAALLVVLTACGGHGGTLAPAPAPTTTVPSGLSLSPTEVSRLLSLAIVTVLDVRTPEEFAVGHLVDAVLIDAEGAGFDAAIAELPSDATYVVYSNGDARASETIVAMGELGFSDVRDLVGGYDAWVAAGLPTST